MAVVTTKSGDKGKSGLMGGHRLEKTDVRFAALGAIDELSAAIGVAKAAASDHSLKEGLEKFQGILVYAGMEVATLKKDFKKYEIRFMRPEAPEELHKTIKILEGRVDIKRFTLPGDTPLHAALHMARTIARRAERELWRLYGVGGLKRDTLCIFMNRLSDLLWLLAEDSLKK